MNVDRPTTPAVVQLVNSSTGASANACTIASSQVASAAVSACSDAASVQCSISYWLYAVGVPVLLLCGTCGNALTVLVMGKRSMGRTAFGTYILAIAISDTLVLWTCLPRHFIRWVWLVDIRELSQWSCRILRYLQFSLMHTSAWLLVTVTTERFLNVYYPTKFRLYKTRRRAACVAGCVALFHFVWNAHIFWTLGEQRLNGCRVKRCGYPNAEVAYYWTQVHTWLDLVKLSLLPFAIMLCMNVAIIVSLRRRMSPAAQTALRRYGRGHGILRLRPLPAAIVSSSPVARRGARSVEGQAQPADGRDAPAPSSSADTTKTAMLLWVSFFYVIVTMPSFISTILDQTNSGPLLLSSFATVAFYSNNAFNFILYSLSGATFRRMFTATISRKQRSSSSSATTSSWRQSTGEQQRRLRGSAVRHHCTAAGGTAQGAMFGGCNSSLWIGSSDPSEKVIKDTASNGTACRVGAQDTLESSGAVCGGQRAENCRVG